MKIIFAGAENVKSFNDVLVPVEAPHLLVSYFYLRKENKVKLHEKLKKLRAQAKYLFLDSGAHTFFTTSGERTW